MPIGELSPPTDRQTVGTFGDMPTQHDFRSAAGSLRTLGATAGSSAVAVNDVHIDVGMRGGTATAIVDAAMNAAFLNARAVMTASESAADEFERRAEVFAEYTRAIQQWRTDMAHWQTRWANYLSEPSENPNAAGPGFKPSEPTRWPLWVEEG